jgi:hypothetical protein
LVERLGLLRAHQGDAAPRIAQVKVEQLWAEIEKGEAG